VNIEVLQNEVQLNLGRDHSQARGTYKNVRLVTNPILQFTDVL